MTIIPGPALQSVVDIAEAMAADLQDGDATVTLHGDRMRACIAHAGRVAITEAEWAIKDGPAEPLVACIPLGALKRRLEGRLAGYADEPAVEVSFKGLQMTLRVGSRRSRIDLADPSQSETPKVLSGIPWDCKATVPLAFLIDSAKRSPGETVEITAKAGRLNWRSDSGTQAYEDSIECPVDGEAQGLFTPEFLLDFLKPATGDSVALDMCSGYPMRISMEVPHGKATVVVAARVMG